MQRSIEGVATETKLSSAHECNFVIEEFHDFGTAGLRNISKPNVILAILKRSELV
jgi:hypothetical protein